jgi:uncharacterized protein (DUF486 family)
MPVALQAVFLLGASYVFMTFAWYTHLKNLHQPIKLDYLWAGLCILGAFTSSFVPDRI